MLPERFLQQRAATLHSRADGAGRNPQDIRCFIVSKSFDIDEYHHGPERLGQLLDALDQEIVALFVEQRYEVVVIALAGVVAGLLRPDRLLAVIAALPVMACLRNERLSDMIPPESYWLIVGAVFIVHYL